MRVNQSAFTLGGLVGSGHLEREEVEIRLAEAADEAGLGRDEIEQTLRSGLDAGIVRNHGEPAGGDDDPETAAQVEDMNIRHAVVMVGGRRPW